MGIAEPADDAHSAENRASVGLTGGTSSGSRRSAITGAGLAFGLTRPSVLLFLSIGVVMHIGIAVAQAAARLRLWDFSHYYVSALAMRTGVNPYTTDLRPLGRQLGLEGIARATDTPFFLLCFAPLTWLRPATAYWIWFAINAVALAVAMSLIVRAASRLDRRQLISLCAIILLYPPLSNHIFFAQTQIIILLLLVTAMRSIEAKHDRTAGLAIAVASLLKVFPLVMIGYMVMRRRWRALLWTVFGLTAGTAAALFAFGLERNVSFVAGTYVTRSAGFLARPANVALGSFIS
ncbi:MAG: alpha,2-mannosyltransferase, partial [Candidatus Binataceae bacterium]|nr:alpha,2-mannosyltransferase [Candidatus Binataceae bacterium]